MPKVKETVYDYAIVGGGIAGLSSAYHLAKDGHEVIVFDKDNCLNNASFNSTAITSHDPDCDWEKVVEKFGIEGARDIWKLGENSMKMLTEYAAKARPKFISKRLPAHIFSTGSKETMAALEWQYEFYKKLGARATFGDGTNLHPSFKKVLTLEMEGQSNNQAILKTLIRIVKYHGGKIMMHSPVAKVVEEGSGALVTTEAGETVRAKSVIFATGEASLMPAFKGRTHKKRTFVLAFEKTKIPKPFRGSVMWDIEDPYHYMRAFRGRIVWVGGNDIFDKEFDAKKEADYYKPVEKFAREKLGFDSSYKRAGQWSGTFYPAADMELPFIGPVAGTPWIANFGFGGTGILMSFASGYLLAEWARGRQTGYKKYFSLDR